MHFVDIHIRLQTVDPVLGRGVASDAIAVRLQQIRAETKGASTAEDVGHISGDAHLRFVAIQVLRNVFFWNFDIPQPLVMAIYVVSIDIRNANLCRSV